MKNPIARPLSTVGLMLLALGAPARAAELGRCVDEDLGADARCGHLTVFEDREAGEGRTIDLEIVLLPATGEKAAEPLFLLAGGPGQGATDLAELALRPFAEVREVRDVVLVDQRGTGGSNRLDCYVDGKADPQAEFGGLWDPDEIGRCFERARTHADPDLYTTDLVVADLDEVRRRLGYERVVLWGGSGGTRTALVYLRDFPGRVVAAVLDGVTPTHFYAPSGYARGCQDSLEKVFADCAAQEECRRAYPRLAEDFEEVLGLFAKGPVATRVEPDDAEPVAVEMYLGDFTYAVRGMLYSGRRIANLPRLIHEAAATGDVGAFAQAHWRRNTAIRSVLAVGVHLGIFCAEDVPFLSRVDLDGLSRGTFLGTYLLDQYRGACESWPVEPVDADFLEPIESDVPVLIFSGHYDPSTPPSDGAEVASHLPNSRHVVVRDESHGAGFGCGRRLQIDFLKQGSFDGLGAACEDAGPIRFTVDAE